MILESIVRSQKKVFLGQKSFWGQKNNFRESYPDTKLKHNWGPLSSTFHGEQPETLIEWKFKSMTDGLTYLLTDRHGLVLEKRACLKTNSEIYLKVSVNSKNVACKLCIGNPYPPQVCNTRRVPKHPVFIYNTISSTCPVEALSKSHTLSYSLPDSLPDPRDFFSFRSNCLSFYAK